MEKNKCIIVVPVHRGTPNSDERASFGQLKKVLGNYDVSLVCPENLNTTEYKKIWGEGLLEQRFGNEYFQTREGYMKLVSNPMFYKAFENYEYLLIYQLDCWVFRDELEYWCDKGYDYIGAPFFIKWFVDRKRQVGNGGFSLRKISSVINYLEKHNDPSLPHFGTDDGFFAANYDDMLKIPSLEEASLFSLEVFPKELYAQSQKVPFGCHAYKKYDWEFWKQFINYNPYDFKKDITFCVLNYKDTENAKVWYKTFKDIFDCYIIDTYVVDNNAENPYKEFGDDNHILLEHNVYNGGQRIIAYQKAVENGSKWMMTVDADITMPEMDKAVKIFLESVGKVVNSDDIGVYEISADRGSKCQGSTQFILENIHLYCHGTGKFREVEEGEGFFRLLRMDIADRIYPYQNFTDNKYGWGGEAFYYLAKQMGLKVVIDDALMVHHPDGITYNNKEAAEERLRFFERLPELGIEIPKRKTAEEIKTLVCCIGKNENRYVREYVEWYKGIGVTHIRIYDNNDPDGEHFEEVIKDYVDEGFVDIVDYRGKKDCQHDAYNVCYEEEKNNYDWILFIDCGDEFLTFNQPRTIGSFLAMPHFVNFDIIHVNLMTFGDCGQVHYESKPLAERFPNPIPFDTKIAYDFPENCHVSSIVRGGLEKVIFSKASGWSHTPSPTTLRCCNDVGITVDGNSPVQNIDFQLAFFRHYTTKTAEEYCDKMRRGFPDQQWDGTRVQNLIETRFFRANEVTKEKVDVFKERLGIDMSYLLPKKFEGKKSDDVKIYTLCYAKKKFHFLDDEVITPLQVGAANGTDVCELKDNTGDNISDKNYFFIENTGTYWIWKNVQAKYKGQMQYRRPLSGICGTTNFEEIFKDYDVITCEPFYHPDHKKPTETEKLVIVADTVEQGYAFSNCIDDLYVLEMVIKMFHPDYAEDYDKYIKNGPNLYYSSGYIMKGEDYDRYCEFLFDCLNKWLEFANIHSKEELYAHVRYNMEVGKYPRYGGDKNIVNDENAVRWQTSIGGFLGERIWTLWMQHNFPQERIYKLPYIKMEDNMYT